MCRRFAHLVLLCALVLVSASLPAFAEKEATLCTSAGADVTESDLAGMISTYISPFANRMITFTQCYGGDCLDSFTGSNTTVTSATSAGQEAVYGGYDDDAAEALRPGGGTAGTVHDAGTAGRDSDETPTTGGGLSPDDFSLEPVDPIYGPVTSRHIVVYAGIPDSNPGRDNDQAQRIRDQFASEPNTTVTTVGGNGTGVWDHPGTAADLAGAIAYAGQMIDDSMFPENEQFILFVTDHGDLHNKQ